MPDSDSDDGGSPTTAAITVSSPLSQKLIKATSNVCFSFFVLSILVITVIAVTYQPPDPWLQSPAAITTSLSAVLPNSTFHPDDSVLPIGADLINATSPNPNNISDGASPNLERSVSHLPNHVINHYNT